MTRAKFLAYHRIAICGDFGQHTPDMIKNWIHNAGGQYVGEFKPNLTHLVCSKEAHRKKVKMGMLTFRATIQILICALLIPLS